GPEGDTAHGWWRFLSVEPERPIEVEDGFAHEDGRPNEEMPTMRMVITFESTPTGSRFTGVTYSPSLEAMEEMTRMGMVEGMKSAVGQPDRVVADLASFASDRATEAQVLSDT